MIIYKISNFFNDSLKQAKLNFAISNLYQLVKQDTATSKMAELSRLKLYVNFAKTCTFQTASVVFVEYFCYVYTETIFRYEFGIFYDDYYFIFA